MEYTKTFNCGCAMLIRNSGVGSITYCPKHKAAPDMYEALRGIIARRMECHEVESASIPSEIGAVYKALAKAEGKEV